MKVEKKILIILFFIIFIMQFILIAHRLSFKPYLLFNFYLPESGIEESLEINIDFKERKGEILADKSQMTDLPFIIGI